MSGSFKKAAKAYQKVHRERPQPADRAHLGPLERKKDYVQRARDHHKKRDKLKVLRKKAAERNPDEFYFNMVSSEKVDGVHQAKNAETQDEEQEMLQRGRDIAYVSSKLNMERKKIEKLKATLSFLDPHFRTNRHTLFVDSEKEAPEALARLRQQSLEDGRTMMPTAEQQQELDKSYRMLAKRYEREKKLATLVSKLEVAQHLQRDKKAKRKLVKEETKDSAAQYRWCFQRKR